MQIQTVLEQLRKTTPQFSADAYNFVIESLNFEIGRQGGDRKHVTGRDLSFALRDLAFEQFGPLARRVLASWGIRSTDDIGVIVFNMVNAGLLSRSDEDKPEDFHQVFPFNEEFDRAYRPAYDERGHIKRQTTPQSSEPIDDDSSGGDTLIN